MLDVGHNKYGLSPWVFCRELKNERGISLLAKFSFPLTAENSVFPILIVLFYEKVRHLLIAH